MSFFFGTTHPNWPETFGNSPRERALGELAKHDHADVATYGDEIPDTSRHRQTYKCDIKDSTARSVITGFKTGAAGNDEYHNNLAPIIGCYAWRRQA